MANETTNAFRKMMLSGRLNQLMNEAIKDGIAATNDALKTKTAKPPENPAPEEKKPE